MGAQLVSRVWQLRQPGRWRDPSGQPDEVEGILSHPWVSLGILALVIVAAIGAADELAIAALPGTIPGRTASGLDLPAAASGVPPRSRPGRPDLPTARGPIPGTGQGRRAIGRRQRLNVTAYLPLPRARRARPHQRAASRHPRGPGLADEGRPDRRVRSSPGRTRPRYGSLPGDLLGLAPDTGRLVVRVPNLRLVLAQPPAARGVVFPRPGRARVGHRGTHRHPGRVGPFGGIVVALPGLVPMLFSVCSPRARA